VTDFPSFMAPRAAVLGTGFALMLALGACSSIEDFAAGDKADYRGSAKATKPAGLEVPPDLTQLAADTRYQSQGGTVSAATFQSGVATGTAAPVAAATAPSVALQSSGDIRVVREGSQRWLSTAQTPEQIWPQLEAFWRDRGIKLATSDAAAGVMETEWVENRAKLPDDIVSNTLGKLFKSLYSTGERDKFRTRVERTASNGSEIYLSHRGVEEVFNSAQKESITWQPRPVDPQLEAEFLSRMMVKLSPVKAEQARAAVAAASAPQARARVLAGRPASTLQLDDSFDRAWRRVGLALDRSGFTVEDRDRAQGLYFVRYVDPAQTGKEEPGFFAKLFSNEPAASTGPARYRVAVKGEGDASTVSVLSSQGTPETGDAGRRIVALLVEDLK
jgi:outer membrane protein assembly factor BamC